MKTKILLAMSAIGLLAGSGTTWALDADTPPFVSATSPVSGSIDVPQNANITLTFTEPVSVTGDWFSIVGDTFGPYAAVVSGGPSSFTLNPTQNFLAGELINVTIFASGVTDQDNNDVGNPDNMLFNYVFSFMVGDTTSVPEPGSIALLGLGLAGLALTRRRKSS